MATTKKAVDRNDIKATPKKSGASKSTKKSLEKIDEVAVRMYCMGTGDCFILRFLAGGKPKFTMMVDCGSCRGDQKDFKPYIQNIIDEVGEIDLLVVTHEHNDHVNGFDKCENQFKELTIKEAWMAWTENPQDPDGSAKDLLRKREHMRKSFQNALTRVQDNKKKIEKELTLDYNNSLSLAATNAFLDGLNTLGEINLAEGAVTGKGLKGMEKIKALLKDKISYLYPGETRLFHQLPGVRFHVLGPPLDKKYVYKNGKEGRDVYKKYFSVGEGILAMNAFADLGEPLQGNQFPFGREYLLDVAELTSEKIAREKEPLQTYLHHCANLVQSYRKATWRNIENEWLYAAGSLGIRLNSHINNTSLVLAIEFVENGDVILLPGDAEYGSWESWHLIEKWLGEGKGGKHFTEDLLNRTKFYKVGHHLSYNGTALEKGIHMMKHPELTVMATLDRERIAERWKNTMPNQQLLKELINRSAGRCFIMNESGIDNPPSKMLKPSNLGEKVYRETHNKKGLLYKEYVVRV